MRAASASFNVLFWLAIIAWIGASMTAAIAAMNVFGTLPKLDLQLGEFAAYDAASHGRLAAGMVMEKVFRTVDLVQFAAAPAAVIALLGQLATGGLAARRLLHTLRLLCVVAAAATLTFQVVALTPAMNRELHAYWDAARAGNATQAEAHRAAFEQDHPVAEDLYQARLILLLFAAAVSALVSTPKPSGSPAPQPQRSTSP